MSLWGQECLLKHYTVEDGLPSNTIYTLYRDHKGYLWVTTDRGVARYNGLRFEKFTTFNGLVDNEVFGCREDNDGRLWFVCSNGELCYYKDDTFHNPKNTPFLRQPRKQPYPKFVNLQKDGSIVYTFYNANYLCYINKNECRTINLDVKEAGVNLTITAEKIGPTRLKLLRSEHQVIIVDFDSATKIISRVYDPTMPHFLDQYGCQGQAYIYNDSAIYTPDQKLVYVLPPGFHKANFMVQIYRNEKYWFFPTKNGLFIDNVGEKREMRRVLADKAVSCVTQGVNKEYWVSTLTDGLYLLPESFASTSITANAYRGKVHYTKEAKGHLFFCGEKQDVNVLEGSKSRLVMKMNLPDLYLFPTCFHIENDASFTLLSRTGNIWVDNLLSKRPEVRHYPTFLFPINVLKRAVKTKDSFYVNTGASVVVTGFRGLHDGDSSHYHELLTEGAQRIFGLAKTESDDVWFTTLDKVYKIENGRAVQQRQFGDFTFKQFEFFGKFLIGYSQYNQLIVCDMTANGVVVDTILNESVWENLYKLDSTHVLISTNSLYYLFTLDNSEKGYNIAVVESRFIPQQADAICVGRDSCYFFKDGSIVTIGKSTVLKRAMPPAVGFTTLRTQGDSIRIGNVVRLPYSKAGNIAISFSTLSFDGKDPSYQYSISRDGTDKWVHIRGDINLANQAFGTYTVKVRAKTVSTEYGMPSIFTLEIIRPFWATWWFITISVCVTALLIYMTVRKRIQMTLRKREREHESKVRYIKSEYKAMNALMNPHFIFNTLNNVQSLVNNGDKLNAIEYLAIFADLIRQNMNNISNEVIPLQKELELVENYLLLEKLRFEDQLNYSIDVSDGVYIEDIDVPPLLIQPLVENSIKHGILPLKSRGVRGTVKVHVYEQRDTLFIEVKDNGIGVAKARERKSLHKSFGLDNLKLRLEQLSIIMGKEITFDLTETIDDDDNRWTVATIALPLGAAVPESKAVRKMVDG